MISITEYEISEKKVPTIYFVGVTTAKSSIMKVFPRWVEILGHPNIVIEGIDHQLHDSPESYRQTVAQIKYDPLSLGALVTSHKISLAEAALDMFDERDPYSKITGEVSCIAKHNEKLVGFAKDPITGGKSLDDIIGDGFFGLNGGEVLCFGAGGSGVAISLHLINKEDTKDRPKKMIVVNRSQGRLIALRKIISQLDTDIEFQFICNDDPKNNDQLMAALPEYSVVINATGLGKDIPGSPITELGKFPRYGIAWEINYRGDLDFWHQAMAQKESRQLKVEDGWLYFIYGWTEHISEVLNIDLDKRIISELEKEAEDLRPPLIYKAK
jgi:shikimate dehydrogenase